jgi:OOP family OmpA-OmpF porin
MQLKRIMLVIFFVLGIVAFTFGEEEGGQTYKDAPYFSGMPNYSIIDQQDKEFDAYQFSDGKKIVTVEGKMWRTQYHLKENEKQASDLQIDRNYANAVKNMGGVVLFEGVCGGDGWGDKSCCQRAMTGKVVKESKELSKELWVEVAPCNGGVDYWLTVLENEAMKQDVTASDMLVALNTKGRIALYINFDTGMAVIKPESQSIIGQIAALMKQNPALKLGIEGHSDNVGDRKKNKFLSEERARSIVGALVNLGIDPKRLTPAGFGQDSPIADNRTEEGKAKNRRVELVKK